MTGGLLDFFTLEAGEYVEQLDALVSRAATAPPDPDAFGRAVRALRGSATMAKVGGIAQLAQGVERLARAVRDGDVAWDAGTRGIAIAAIDDAKILIRAVRTWGAKEDALVTARVGELDRVAPARRVSEQRGGGSAFLAAAAADAAAGLLEYAENPTGGTSFAQVMGKVRALRGVAALTDLPPLAEVVDAVDAAAKPIELGHEDATAERRRLFRTAARVLLEGGDAVRLGGVPAPDTPAVQEFALAAATLGAATGDGDDVVPIAALLADSDDAVSAASNPPTTAAQRFRLEVVSQAEHLRRLVAEGRVASDAATRDRVGRDLRGGVRALARAAQSFAVTDIAQLFLAAERGASELEPTTLDILDRAALLLSRPDVEVSSAGEQFVALTEALNDARSGTRRTLTPASAARVSPTSTAAAAPAAQAAQAASAPAPSRAGTAPSGAALRNLLATGIAGLAPLAEEHLAAPLVGDEDDVIPIDELLFRGREALARALEIGDRLRQGAAAPDAATLAELYDLLQLAAAE